MIVSGLMWIIVLIIAYFAVPKGYKFLNDLKLGRTKVAGLLTGDNGGPLKSVNYIPSTIEDQNILSSIEQELVKQLMVESRAPRNLSFSNRWLNANYPSGSTLPDSVFRDVSRIMMCTNLNNSIEFCEDVKLLTKDSSIYGLKSKERVIIGIKMVLERTPCSAAQFRIQLHKHFEKKIWPVIKRNIDFSNEDREIIYVGYDSGGALATLAAWNSIQRFEALNPSAAIIKNANNQVKVFTWDELPLFTLKTAAKSPLLPCNHSRFSTIDIPNSYYRSNVRESGGLDEISYFSTSGDEISLKAIDYADFEARLKIKSNEDDPDTNPRSEATKLLSSHCKEKVLKELSQERLNKLVSILVDHRQHLLIMHELVLNKYRVYLTDTVLEEPNSCASAVAKKLSNEIFPGSTITCRVDGFEHVIKAFQIRCSYKPTKLDIFSHLITFDAILGDSSAHELGRDILAFMDEVITSDANVPEPVEEVNIKTKKSKTKITSKTEPNESRSLRYIGPDPINDNWTSCLFELFQPNDKLTLISPFDIRNKNIYPRITYVPFDPAFKRKASSTNTGCYLRAPNVGHELLQVFKADPQFFYRAVDPKTMRFPPRCHKLLFHIPFDVQERKSLQMLQQKAVDYLIQLISKNPVADPEVTLWNPRDTDDFRTLSFHGSTVVSSKDLVDRSNYPDNFENGIIKCLSSPSYPYRDCTNPINLWVPKACPASCFLVNESNNFICKQVKSCQSAGYFISISYEGNSKRLTDLTKSLTKRVHPQFGIFNVQKREMMSTSFNLALFRMPSDD